MKIQEEAFIPTKWGDFRMLAYGEEQEYSPHIAFVNGELEGPVLTRIHSECITGDVFGSLRCDCGEQLAYSLEKIGQEGGILIYLRQEGRGIGIINKMKAYNLQDQGMDTVEANLYLGFHADDRSYEPALSILQELHISQIRLLTNNPDKLAAFDKSGIQVVKREPIIIPARRENKSYLETKQSSMGHLLGL
ncbi:MAG: GTP cyclohydrolase II [Bacteroidota bacterium]